MRDHTFLVFTYNDRCISFLLKRPAQNSINDTRREFLIICVTQLAVRFIATVAVAGGQVHGKTDRTYMITRRITTKIN